MGNSHGSQAQKTDAQYKKLARLLTDGVAISTAMVQAGWSENQASKGWAAVPDGVIKIMSKNNKGRRLISLGRSTPKEDQEAMITGRLIENITKGTDKAAQSAKILGSKRDLNLWQPDQLSGVIVLTAPQWLIEHKAELLADDPDDVILPPVPANTELSKGKE